jgi:hypothetical protein
MRFALLFLACVALCGCGAFTGGSDGKAPSDATGGEAVDPEHFRGNHIGVWVDGNKALKEPAPAGAGMTYWSVQPVGASMEIRVSPVESHLGKVVRMLVVLNPAMEDGSPDVRDVWEPLGIGKFEPDTACRISDPDGFRHISSDTVNPRQTLIPGKYVMTVRVSGEISWDRKLIRLDVR